MKTYILFIVFALIGCEKIDMDQKNISELFETYIKALEDSNFVTYSQVVYVGEDRDSYTKKFFQYDISAYKANKVITNIYKENGVQKFNRGNGKNIPLLARFSPKKDDEGNYIIEIKKANDYSGVVVDVMGLTGPYLVNVIKRKLVLDTSSHFIDLDTFVKDTLIPTTNLCKSILNVAERNKNEVIPIDTFRLNVVSEFKRLNEVH